MSRRDSIPLCRICISALDQLSARSFLHLFCGPPLSSAEDLLDPSAVAVPFRVLLLLTITVVAFVVDVLLLLLSCVLVLWLLSLPVSRATEALRFVILRMI